MKGHKTAISTPAAGSPADVSSCYPSYQLPDPTVPWLPWLFITKTYHLLQKDRLWTQRGWKMLPGRNRFSPPTVTFEGQFPLGPFPRHIWIHNNTPQDSLDEACHKIWKRVQRLSEELQPLSLVPPLQHAPCSVLSGTLQRDTIDSQSK